jgi:hypothetical protein
LVCSFFALWAKKEHTIHVKVPCCRRRKLPFV